MFLNKQEHAGGCEIAHQPENTRLGLDRHGNDKRDVEPMRFTCVRQCLGAYAALFIFLFALYSFISLNVHN
jgi:hypothetical protein